MLVFVPRVLVIPEVEPRPAVKPAALDAADVIRHEVFAQLVPLIRAHPKVVGPRPELDADRVPDSPGENILAGAVGIELEDAGAIGFGGVVRSIRERADRDIHFYPGPRERDVACPMPAAAQKSTTGKLGTQFLRGPAP